MVGNERHLGDHSGVALMAHLHLHSGSGSVETLLDVTHSHRLLQRGRQRARGDLTDLLAVGEDLGTVTSGRALDHEAHTLLLAGLHLRLTSSPRHLHAP